MKKKTLFVAIVLGFGGILHADIPDFERAALIDFYNSTNGGTWSHSTNWLNAAGTECSWYGVTCNGAGDSVVAIDLHSNGLSGSIPTSIEDLPNLTLVNLSSNWNLGGSIPSEIGTLLLLETLDLGYGGNLTGGIPPSLGNLSNLRTLDIDSQTLTGTIPSELGSLSNLLFFDLSYNQLSGDIPTAFDGLSSLVELHLSGNQLGGNLPAELGSLSNLSVLNLGSNQFTGGVPPDLVNLSNLEVLNLSYNQLTGGIPSFLGTLTLLSRLFLGDNQLTGGIPPELGDLSALQWLGLDSNQLSGEIPQQLENLINLKGLYLDSNQLDGDIPSGLGSLTALNYLQLQSNQLSGSIPPALANPPDLVRLDLSGNQLVGSIPAGLGTLSNLSRLYLGSNRLSGSIPPQLGDLTNLLYLHLGSNNLSGEIPSELASLTGLYDSNGLDLRWDALHTDDASLLAFLNSKQIDGDWESKQTIPPEYPAVMGVGDHTVWLVWTGVSYTVDPGGYEIYSKETTGSEWTMRGATASKDITSFPVTGLSSGTLYDLAVKTFTQAHAFNQNRVLSDLSLLTTAMTASTGCTAPEISKTGSSPWTLAVTDLFDDYNWSTGETTQSIMVAPTEPTWYYVTTTATGPCEESAVILVDPVGIFADGFEDGTLSAWSSSMP